MAIRSSAEMATEALAEYGGNRLEFLREDAWTIARNAVEDDRAQRESEVLAQKVWVRKDFALELEQRGLILTRKQASKILDYATDNRYVEALSECTSQDWELVAQAVDLGIHMCREDEEVAEIVEDA